MPTLSGGSVEVVDAAIVAADEVSSTSFVLKGDGSGKAVAATPGTDYVAPGGALGTPSSGTLTSCTGLPVTTGVSGLGTGVATFLATPSSVNLKAAITDETGSGAAVFATSPTLVTPLLGTPTSGVLTNCTGTAAGLTAGAATLAATSTALATSRAINGVNFDGTAAITTGLPVTVKVTSANYTVGTTSSLELYGGIIYVTSAATITIPAVAVGVNFTVVTKGAIAVSVDPNGADLLILDGTALADGEKATNLSTAGDILVISYYDATGWYAASNGWTNGG